MSVLGYPQAALHPSHHPSAIPASLRYDAPFHNSEGRDSYGFRLCAYPWQFSPLMQGFDSFSGDSGAIRVKQNDITSQDNFTINQEGSHQPALDTRNAPDIWTQLRPRSAFWPQANGPLSSFMKEDIATHNGVLGSNYVQMGENTNLVTSIEGPAVPFYIVVVSGKSRRYQCGCGHVTRRKGDMRRHHETRKHAHKNYTCSCGISFTRSDSLKRHKKKTCKKGRI